MADATRTRTRKTARSQAKNEAADGKITPEEAEIAAAQENAELQQGINGYLQNRVATLRVQLNRANKEIERLKAQIDKG